MRFRVGSRLCLFTLFIRTDLKVLSWAWWSQRLKRCSLAKEVSGLTLCVVWAFTMLSRSCGCCFQSRLGQILSTIIFRLESMWFPTQKAWIYVGKNSAIVKKFPSFRLNSWTSFHSFYLCSKLACSQWFRYDKTHFHLDWIQCVGIHAKMKDFMAVKSILLLKVAENSQLNWNF